MLLVGTARHLEDLERQYTIAEDVDVTSVAVVTGGRSLPASDPGAGIAYAMVDRARLARVEAFELAPLVALPGEASGRSLAAGSDRLVVGTAGARLLTVDPATGDVAATDAFDAVEGRADWHEPGAGEPTVRSIAVTAAGTWLVGVHVGGVWRSSDEGASWTCVVPPEADIHELAAGSGGQVAAAAAGGLGWSEDDGATWRWTADGLHAPYARAVAVDGDLVYVTASTGPRSTDGRCYRGRRGGPLAPCGPGLPSSFPFNLDTGCLAARGGEVALGTREGIVYRSGDGGATFEAVTERLPPVRVLRFA